MYGGRVFLTGNHLLVSVVQLNQLTTYRKVFK
ncbi:Uncharacterised protein [Vibrio cholerae]|nr:Uncharacterised protein [Vibrio cholerae]